MSSLSQSSASIQLTEQAFRARFPATEYFMDVFGREYSLCHDTLNGNRPCILKFYLFENEEQELAAYQNLHNYEQMRSVEGICKILAYANNGSDQVMSVFQFHDISLEKLIQKSPLPLPPLQLYLALLSSIANMIQHLQSLGLDLEDIIPSIILLSSNENNYIQGSISTIIQWQIRVLYDERGQKNYDKILEGAKIYWSEQRFRTQAFENNDYLDSDSIFQLGLMLLDLMIQLQTGSSAQVDGGAFSRDIPLTRSSIVSQPYHILTQNSVQLNRHLIQQHLAYLQQKNDKPILKALAGIVRRMVGEGDSPIGIEQVAGEADRLLKIYRDAHKKAAIIPNQNAESSTFLAHPNQQVIDSLQYSISNQSNSIQNSIRQSASFPNHQPSPAKIGGLISNSTIQTDHFKPQSSTETIKMPATMEGMDPIANITAEGLIGSIPVHSDIISSLHNMISKLKMLHSVKKQYYDGSVYYGEVAGSPQKRTGQGIYVNAQGDLYFGDWQNNVLMKGCYIFKNGESYEGVVRGGKQGYGRYRYSNGNVYEGEWKDDVKSGKGFMRYPNGDSYQGSWQKGKKNGQGIYKYHNGTIYEGGFVGGRKHGQGCITFTNGTKVYASWQSTHIQGNGKINYPNGEYFEGNFHLSEKNGQGVYMWDECQYEGEFRKDILEGYARVTFSGGENYQGRIKGGKREGQGTYHYPNGDKFVGEWKNDCKLMGSYFFSNGDTFEGRFKLNQMNFGVMIYGNGEKYEGQWQKGKRQGVGCYRDRDGNIIWEGSWQNDQVAPLH